MNESSNWGQMGKSTYPIHSNPNPMKKRQKTFHEVPASVSQVNQTSMSQQQTGIFNCYVSFKVSLFSRTEIRELRERFYRELNQVRGVLNRIESGLYSNVGSFRNQLKADWSVLLKECGKIMTKLLKHKNAYVFNVPVDAAAFQLHDYHMIVKRPMDLGTVKANLGKKVYLNPMEFAGDVRLTFNNALLYNPKTNAVNGMAEEMLARFEELFRPVQEKIDVILSREREVRDLRVVNDEMPVETRVFNPLHSSRQMVKNVRAGTSLPFEVIKKPIERIPQMPVPVPAVYQQELIRERFFPPPVKELKGVGRVGVKQAKPRAKDENKREMSIDEKQKLGFVLQSIPGEKMQQVIQIVRKRNERFAQGDDEVELDIETLDTETLWELDRFVTNWKKYLSKNKQQGMINPTTPTVPAPSTPVTETDMGVVSDKNDSVKEMKDYDDEDVDIDDDMPATEFPTVEIEKDEEGGVDEVHEQGQDQKDNGNGNASSSSSSSTSSSSSDSDSGSSSGSDSEADEAQP